MIFGSLFSGIGGLDLGLERAGMTCAWQVEINDYAQRVLSKHWPDVPKFRDVREVRGWEVEPVNLLAGGFPCQDISDAHTTNERRALRGLKSGLWSEFRRLVHVLAPRWVLVENVAAWRRWMPEVRSDLAALGYASLPVEVCASFLGAHHERPRVFVIAHADGESEPLRAIDAKVAGLRAIPVADGHWRNPTPGNFRVADGLPDRMERNRGIGNAVSPVVAEFIGRRILAAAEAA